MHNKSARVYMYSNIITKILPLDQSPFPKNISDKGECLEPKTGLPHAPQPGQHLKKRKKFSIRVLSGFLEGNVVYLFGMTNGWTMVRFEALSRVH